MKGRTDRPEGENMKSFKNIIAGMAIAAGIMFAPVTSFAAEEVENNLPTMEVVEEATEVVNEEVVFSIPTATVAEETTTETAEADEEVVEETSVEATDETVEATAETVEEAIVDETTEQVTSDDENNEVVESNEEVANDVTESNDESTEEVVPSDVELVLDDITPAPAANEAVEIVDDANADSTEAVDETADTTVDNTVALVAGVDATAADAAETASDDAANESVTGRQIGTANNGYAEMSDGSAAFCIEQEKDHIEEDVTYTREDDVDGSDFDNIFAARQEALDAQELSSEDVNKITQLAVWAVISGESYQDLVDFYYHENGVALYEKMFQKYEGDWTFKYWGYTPSSDMYQKLIAGQASKVVTPDEPEEPTEPDEPVIPDQPSEPEVPDVPDVPETPDTPDEPTVPEQPSQPEVPTAPQEPVVLSQVFEAPTTNVPVLSARMASTGDNSNTAARMAVIFAMAAVVALLCKKENI